MKTIKTIWECWNYDVWGNSEEGYEVNDRMCFNRSCNLELEVQIANPDTKLQFEYAFPSDNQIKNVFGIWEDITLEGDDTTIYVNMKEDDYPVGEMNCISHDCLSPTRKNAEYKEEV